MVDTLKDLKGHHHVVEVKAEFEAEGTRIEEMLRLKEVCMSAGLGLTVKIGGCEAIRDMYECRVIGVERIVAPMVESPYALKKFLAATTLAFPADGRQDVKYAVNIETITSARALDEMLALPEIDSLDGVVVGRVAMTGSLGLGRDEVNSPQIFEILRDVRVKAKAKGLENTCGGGGAQAIPFFRDLPEGARDRYETRTVIFRCPGALGPDAEKGLLKAVGFELRWLKNKRDYYGLIAAEDEQRIGMLESRYKSGIEAAGGKDE